MFALSLFRFLIPPPSPLSRKDKLETLASEINAAGVGKAGNNSQQSARC